MEQRDYLLRQIEMMGLFLQKLIARARKRKENEETDEKADTIKNEFQNELKINIDDLIVLKDEDFFEILKEKQFTDQLFENLAKLFIILGETNDIEFSLNKQNLLNKALSIYLKLEEESHNYSFERNEQITRIRQMINNF